MSKLTKNQRITELEKQVAIISKVLCTPSDDEPKLKQLDQSVFDGLDEKWRFAAINKAGRLMLSASIMASDEKYWYCQFAGDLQNKGNGYNATDWQNSLIERDKVELTGSNLCRAMLERGDKIVLCIVKDHEYGDDYYDAITGVSDNGCFDSTLSCWEIAVPVNNQGEPLTAKDVGL